MTESSGFEVFVAGRGRGLWRTAWLLTGDPHSAEDLVQIALMRAWPKYESLRASDGDFEGYVRRTMVNAFLSTKRRRRVPEILGDLAHDHDALRAASGQEAEDRMLIWEVLARLSRQQRATIVLRFYEDLSEAAAAAALGCSIGTVKTHQRRALAAMRSDPAMRTIAGKDTAS